jgi:electron transfer flavoprotein beta subunit
MRALVCVKRVIDYTVKVRVRPDKMGVVKDNVKHSCNPFDEIAVEQAVRMKEAKKVTEIVAVSIGGPKTIEILRGSALALGVDKAILIKLPKDDTEVEALAVAKILKGVVDKVKPDIVLAGKQAIDDDSCAVPQMLASMLGWSQGTFLSALAVEGKMAKISRETDVGIQKLEISLPAVFSCDLRLNEPRYAKLPEIMKAKKKPLEEIDVKTTGVDIAPRLEIVQVADPPTRAAGKKVKTAEELMDKLKNEAKVL